jgi:antibiotic biosynthesis monooxygenase (ABM) superfamily enzyme
MVDLVGICRDFRIEEMKMRDLMERTNERPATEPVTIILSWEVAPGREAAFEQWAHGVTRAATKYPGHLGASWLRPNPGSHTYHTVLKFDTLEHYTAWESSDELGQWLKRAEEFTHKGQVQTTGLETWFTLPGKPIATPPPRWKMWLVTLCAIYPLSLAFQIFIAPFLTSLPLAIRAILLSLILVTLLTYLVMPTLTKLLKPWLYPGG